MSADLREGSARFFRLFEQLGVALAGGGALAAGGAPRVASSKVKRASEGSFSG